MSIRVDAITGHGLRARLADLARLRIEVFFDYPYLYDGDLDYETTYLAALGASPDAIIAGAFDGDTIVGAATGAPLAHQAPEIVAPFRARGLPLSDYFYFGESVLKRGYRGQGIGVRFFELREAQARRVGAKVAIFCPVVRPADHPRRPADYVLLDAFWTHRGYAPVPGLQCEISWKELDETHETPKAMQFWQKRLS
jgi:GNAT superfamily N-acetyltransferase